MSRYPRICFSVAAFAGILLMPDVAYAHGEEVLLAVVVSPLALIACIVASFLMFRKTNYLILATGAALIASAGFTFFAMDRYSRIDHNLIIALEVIVPVFVIVLVYVTYLLRGGRKRI